LAQTFDFKYRHKNCSIRLTDEQTLELYVDNCLRKDRPRGDREPQYVWTNVELEWEEHHYIEARYWASENRLQVSVNGEPVLEELLSPA